MTFIDMMRWLLNYFEKTSTGDKRLMDQTTHYEAGLKDMQISVSRASSEARAVTQRLQSDAMKRDAVVLCDITGVINKSNVEATEMFAIDVNGHHVDEMLHSGQSWEALIAIQSLVGKTVTMTAAPYKGEMFTAEVTVVRLIDTPPVTPRVLLMIRSTEVMKQQYRDIATRVQEALDRLNERVLRADNQ